MVGRGYQSPHGRPAPQVRFATVGSGVKIWRTGAVLGCAMVAVLAILLDAASASAAPTPLTPRISLSASKSRVPAGSAVTLSGRVRGEVTPVRVDLYSIPWP